MSTGTLQTLGTPGCLRKPGNVISMLTSVCFAEHIYHYVVLLKRDNNQALVHCIAL